MPPPCPICAPLAPSSICPLASELVDEERMAFLTSYPAPGDTSARDQMVAFWGKAADHAFEQAPSLSLEPRGLAGGSMAWGGATGPGMELAIAHMLSSGTLLPREQVEAKAGLARRYVVTPLVTLMGMMGLASDAGKFAAGQVPAGQHVHRGVLESLAEAVMSYCRHLPSDERTVYLLANGHKQPTAFATDPVEGDANASSWGFQQLCAAVGLSAPKGSTPSRMLPGLDRNDLELFAAYLVRTKRAAQEEGLLKVLVPGDEGWGGRTAISETDRDLLRLRCTVASLRANAADLGARVEQCRQDALRENRRGQKRAALMQLRRIRQLHTKRGSRLVSLYTLETALDQVRQLRLDKQVLEAHEAATSALKACRESQGLTVERVEDTLDALAEEMEEHQAIASALSQNNQLPQDDDERAQLEAELADLLREEPTATAPEIAPDVDPNGGVGSLKPPRDSTVTTDPPPSNPVAPTGVVPSPAKPAVAT